MGNDRIDPATRRTWRLDQISALYELIDEAERGEVDPTDGLRRLRRIRTMPARHGAVVTVPAYAVMTIGLCLVLQPTPGDVAIAAGLGVLVGGIVHAARGRQTLTVLVPVSIALGVLVGVSLYRGLAHPRWLRGIGRTERGSLTIRRRAK